jgi:hypothetical protein
MTINTTDRIQQSVISKPSNISVLCTIESDGRIIESIELCSGDNTGQECIPYELPRLQTLSGDVLITLIYSEN